MLNMYQFHVTCTLTNSLHIRNNMLKRIKRKRTLHWLLMKLVCIVDHLLLSCCLTITNSFILQATRNSPDHYSRPRWFQFGRCCRIKHYAGSVTYSVDGFVAKNSDLLERDLSAVMFQSEHPLLKTLFPEGNMKRSMRRRPATVATQFKISIGALINNLGSKTAHFVRCIKPNENRLSR